MNNTKPKAGPYPLHIEIVTNVGKLHVITAQGNSFASTYDPGAARQILAIPDVRQALREAVEAITALVAVNGEDVDDADRTTAMAVARDAKKTIRAAVRKADRGRLKK